MKITIMENGNTRKTFDITPQDTLRSNIDIDITNSYVDDEDETKPRAKLTEFFEAFFGDDIFHYLKLIAISFVFIILFGFACEGFRVTFAKQGELKVISNMVGEDGISPAWADLQWDESLQSAIDSGITLENINIVHEGVDTYFEGDEDITTHLYVVYTYQEILTNNPPIFAEDYFEQLKAQNKNIRKYYVIGWK